MSRKDFEFLAQKISQIADIQSRRQAADAVSHVCQLSNPRFDRVRFYRACGL